MLEQHRLPPGLALGLREPTGSVAWVLSQVHSRTAKQRVVWKNTNITIILLVRVANISHPSSFKENEQATKREIPRRIKKIPPTQN